MPPPIKLPQPLSLSALFALKPPPPIPWQRQRRATAAMPAFEAGLATILADRQTKATENQKSSTAAASFPTASSPLSPSSSSTAAQQQQPRPRPTPTPTPTAGIIHTTTAAASDQQRSQPAPGATLTPSIPALLATINAQIASATHTPWRLAPPRGAGMERTYVFPTPAHAATFCARVAEQARGSMRQPEWAGCGRVVYLRWTKGFRPNPPKARPAAYSGDAWATKRLALGDVWCAEASERIAAEVMGRDGEQWGSGVPAMVFVGEVRPSLDGGLEEGLEGVLEGEANGDDGLEEGVEGRQGREDDLALWPEWKEMEWREDARIQLWVRGEMAKMAEWIHAKALGKGCSSADGAFWPAWSCSFGFACVTQTRWAVEADEHGNVARVVGEQKQRTPADVEAMRALSETTRPHDEIDERKLGQTMRGGPAKCENLLEEVVGRRR